jgi:hypothetical protein
VVVFGRLKVTHLVIMIAVVIGGARPAEISKSRYGFWSRWVFGCIGVQRLRLVLVSVPHPKLQSVGPSLTPPLLQNRT